MVGDKMAQKLLDSIGDMLGTTKPKKDVKLKDTDGELPDIEDVVLPSGEKQSRLVEPNELSEEDPKDNSKMSDPKPIQSGSKGSLKEGDSQEQANTNSEYATHNHPINENDIKAIEKEGKGKLLKEPKIKPFNTKDTQNEAPLSDDDGDSISLDPTSDLSDERLVK